MLTLRPSLIPQVLQHAIHISELPSSKQEDALAKLPYAVRMRVQQILHDQAVIEGEPAVAVPSPPAMATATPVSSYVTPASGHVIVTEEFRLDSEELEDSPTAGPPSTAAAVASSPARQAAATPRSRLQATSSDQHTTARDGPPSAAVSSNARPGSVTLHEEHDLLGMSQPASATQRHHDVSDDLLGFNSHATPAAGPTATPDAADHMPTVDVDDMGDFFSGGGSSAGSNHKATAATAAATSAPAATTTAYKSSGVHSSSSDSHLADFFGGSGTGAAAHKAGSGAHKSSSMINLGGLDSLHSNVDVSGHR